MKSQYTPRGTIADTVREQNNDDSLLQFRIWARILKVSDYSFETLDYLVDILLWLSTVMSLVSKEQSDNTIMCSLSFWLNL